METRGVLRAGILGGLVISSLMTACATSRTNAWQALADRAKWLACEYDLEAAAADDELLTKEYRKAARKARELERVCRLDHAREARNLYQRGGIAAIDARLCDLEGDVREVRQLLSRRSRLLAELTAQQKTGGDTVPERRKAKSLQQLLQSAESASQLRDIVAEVEAQQTQGQQPSNQEAERHGWLKARTVAELEKVTKLLAAEPDEEANRSRRNRLTGAKTELEGAMKLIEATETPSRYTLDDAQRRLEVAQQAVADNEADPVLYPSKWFRVHAGAIALSPYVLQRQSEPDGRFELTNAGDQTTAYLELDFFGREAWLSPEDRLTRNADVGLTMLSDWLVPHDYEARLRFLSDSSDNIDGSQSAASGDISLETNLGWNIIGIGLRDAAECARNPTSKKLPQGTINIEWGAGFLTDRGAIDAHGYVQLGLGTVWSIPLQISTTQWRPATLYTFIGYGLSDFPQFDSDLVQYRDTARAEFNTLGALSARIDATVPLFGSVDLVGGVRYWDPLISERTPENWSVFVGLSVPLGKFFKVAGEAGGG